MKINPNWAIASLAEVKPGSLLIYDGKAGPALALKAADKEAGAEKLIVHLGPSETTDMVPGQLTTWQTETVLSLKEAYEVRLPTEAAGWMFQPPKLNQLALALMPNGLYLRAKTVFAGGGKTCMVKISDGSVAYGWGNPEIVYAISWQLVTTDDAYRERIILDVAQLVTAEARNAT